MERVTSAETHARETSMQTCEKGHRCEMRDTRCEIRDARYEMRDVRCEMRDVRCEPELVHELRVIGTSRHEQRSDLGDAET